MTIKFEWDERKAVSNFQKHGVRFELAVQVFDDKLHISTQDRIENGELRWQTIGKVADFFLVTVAHTIIAEGNTEVIRIISARPATSKERKHYEK